ncbi:MAG: glycosyltransferase family 4 protein [Bacteroidales bacterium]|jgi:glycosyltransferase involved in cell wall biosynthesis|nr:glycosyltransferase family 4 protein [Bacteroidales bacterium]
MKFVFWQNILSIHQSAFLRNLAEKYPVTLVVEESIGKERTQEGWIDPNFGKTDIVVSPDEVHFHQMIENPEAIHVFSGIDSFDLASRAFKIAVRQKKRLGVILEPYDWLGWKGKLRGIKYRILKMLYNNSIEFLLAIGEKGRWCYEHTGFSRQKIFDWAYFTEKLSFPIPTSHKVLPTVIFVGRLDDNKNVLSLISICRKYEEKLNKLEIIGNGPLKEQVIEMIQNTKFDYLGTLSNDKVQQKINEADLLVLPSRYKDGWGAVVNEALMAGVPAIASDYCGSSILLNGFRGKCFSVRKNNLEEIFVGFLKSLPYCIEEKLKIREWAENNISGVSAANYFESIMRHIYSSEEKPIAPWLKNYTD